jgi:hypothetical protein
MAYVRDEKEKLEIDYPLEKLWEAIPKVVATLEWKIEEKDEINHKAKLKTKSGFMSYGSTLSVEVLSVNKKTSRMYINAETPVTTITSMADFGRTRDRIEAFLIMLAKQLENKK